MRLLFLCSGFLLSFLLFQGLKSECQSSATLSRALKAAGTKLRFDKQLPLHARLAIECLGVHEKPAGSNRGDSIDAWIKLFKFKRPVPWCAIFASIKSRQGGVIKPKVWSARANDFIVKGCTRKLTDILYNRYIPQPGDYKIKRRKGGAHVDIFLSWDSETKTGTVIGGNVNDRVKIRKVSLRSMIQDGTKGITMVAGTY